MVDWTKRAKYENLKENKTIEDVVEVKIEADVEAEEKAKAELDKGIETLNLKGLKEMAAELNIEYPAKATKKELKEIIQNEVEPVVSDEDAPEDVE